MSVAINTETVNTIIGSRIRLRRKAIGMTLAELGKKAHFSVGFLSDLENGKRGVSAENLLSIAKSLNVTPNWFFRPLL